jgi:hypothetical protein
VNEQTPRPRSVAARAVTRSIVRSGALLVSGRCHLSRGHVGWRLVFGDGTSAPVYRETVVDRVPMEPCALVVSFRLRMVRGRGHRAFRWESILNTPLFVGFPGFVSKLWLAHDELGNYRGLYEWDGPSRAEHYARCLWRVLAIVSVPGSIRYRVLPGLTLDALLADQAQSDVPDWWRPAASIEGTSDPPAMDSPSVP